ncbi:haloacid dehalogenase [Bacteroidia bacterium]|nr:haloacid dehalogenase [Bacteroidia bacterium]
MAIKNIIFDFGNVFIDWNPRYLFRKMIPAQELENFMQTVWHDEWNDNLDSGISLADNMKNMQAKYPQHSQYIAAYHERWAESLGEVNKDTVALLADLQAAGYATYGLSNWAAETFPLARNANPFFETLDGIVVSGYEKVCKPDPRIYNILLERYHLQAQESVFIDDRQENIDTAQRLGIATILFKNVEQVRAALTGMGVL